METVILSHLMKIAYMMVAIVTNIEIVFHKTYDFPSCFDSERRSVDELGVFADPTDFNLHGIYQQARQQVVALNQISIAKKSAFVETWNNIRFYVNQNNHKIAAKITLLSSKSHNAKYLSTVR